MSINDKLPHLVAFMCICQFTCSHGARYIGRSQSLLSTRLRELVPVWSYKGNSKAIRSSIFENLIDPNHITDPEVEFKVVCMIPSGPPRFFHIKLLRIAESLTIHDPKPEMCVQEKYVLSLSLP